MDSTIELRMTGLVGLWRAHGVVIRGAASLESIAFAEKRLGRTLPPAATAMYQSVDGMAPSDADFPITSRLIRIWPLTELRVSTADEAAEFAGSIIFADYLVHSHDYSVTMDEKVVLIAGDNSHVVARSLTSFLAAYLADDPQIFQ